MTESNTSSDLNHRNAGKFASRDHKAGQTRILFPAETPREKMTRVIKSVRKKRGT